MPLKKGSSQKTVSANIRTLVEDYTKSGRIGTSKPANKKAAVKQAVAISLRQAGKPKPQKYATGGSVTRTSTSTRTASQTRNQQEEAPQRKTPEYLPLPNQSGQVEDQFPKFAQTRMQMRFTPEQFDVSKGPAAARQRTAMRRGGQVNLNKKSRRK
jgi:hypothetical protein